MKQAQDRALSRALPDAELDAFFANESTVDEGAQYERFLRHAVAAVVPPPQPPKNELSARVAALLFDEPKES